jgi:hypothetical protein
VELLLIAVIIFFVIGVTKSHNPYSRRLSRYPKKTHAVSFCIDCLEIHIMCKSLRHRFTKSALVLLLVCVSTMAFSAKPPPEVVQSIDNLAMTGASLNNCFQSNEFKKLSTKQAMRIHDSSSQIESIVTKIQSHYRTSNLLPAYHVAVVQYMDSTSIKQQTIQRYRSLCSNTFIDAVEAYVNQSNQKINAFLSSGRR